MDSNSGGNITASVSESQASPQLQIDIPSLSQMVLRLGADGLKRIQMSGVDLHTIGCLVALGEVTPASATFRKKLLACRRDQRSRRWFLNAVLEYGSGTNTVVDQLLTTRAGENVLALLVAVTSVLDDMTIDVVMGIFELLHVPYRSIPGISQIENVRSSCLPLARATDFKDRVARTHEMILRDAFVSKRPFDHRDALPDSATMAKLIVELKTRCLEPTQFERCRIVYYGLTGAAWCVEYSKDVLGLDVCLIQEDGTVCPVSGTFETASVIVLPAQEPGVELTQRVAHVIDICISSDGIEIQKEINWLVSCEGSGVDFFQLCCGWDLMDRKEIGNLIYSISKEYVEYRIYLGHTENSEQTIPYYATFIEDILENLRRILQLLGLPSEPIFQTDWRQRNFDQLEGPAFRLKLELFSKMAFASISSHCGNNCDCALGCLPLRPVELAEDPSFCVRYKLQDAIISTAHRASFLAFTDWAEECRMMAIATERGHEHKFFRAVFSRYSGKMAATMIQGLSGVLGLSNEDFGIELANVLTGSGKALQRLGIPKRKFIGADLDGVLLINYRAVESSLRPGPIFMIRGGQFLLAGERREVVQEVPFHINQVPHENMRAAMFGMAINGDVMTLKPVNGYPHIINSPAVEASVAKGAINLNLTAQLAEHHCIQARVGDILKQLSVLRVTTPCCHPVDTPLSTQVEYLNNTLGLGEPWLRDEEGNFWVTPSSPEPFYIDPARLETKESIYIRNENPTFIYCLATAANPLAQWLAVANSNCVPGRYLCVLQRDCCLACAASQAKSWMASTIAEPLRRICIIPLIESSR
ncbi:hypothetical protein BGZ63DRAFT_462815 [Mariannaea sp. PMI_226]|nr:hypothetical protein BGZ63DRAFT_462815 [Mariannaea sp. PMI_226]